MALAPSLWVALLSLFTAIPSALMIARLCMDFKQIRKRGYTHHIVIGTVCASIAWICLLVASGMAFWRNERRDVLMGRHAEKSNGGGRLPEMEALGRPLIEATVLHSYVVPTGLWLVKGSFIAMYYSLGRHLTKFLRFFLYIVIGYLVASYLALILSHTLWCSRSPYAHTSTSYCSSFTSKFPISFYAFTNISSDLLVMFTPLLLIRTTSHTPRQLRGIAFLVFLGMGMIATTATCCALHITYRQHLVVYYGSVQTAELLACIELSVGVSAVALPSLRAMISRKKEKRRKKSGVSVDGSGSFGVVSRDEAVRGSRIVSTNDWEQDVEPLSPWDEGNSSQLVIMKTVEYGVKSTEGRLEKLEPAVVAPEKGRMLAV